MKPRPFRRRAWFYFILSSFAALLITSQPAEADPSKYPQFAQQSPPANVAFISVDELAKDVRAGKRPLIIDVRTEEEYHEVHILGSVSAPLGEFNAYLKSIPKDRLVILY
jgi:Rhodanese-like domain